ncbi:hypothetical protein BAUCODRAFT_403647 [Baudoinia panamericana UAMH 10762]|uniref:HORMA domain-containing protein n=1 Tax=Baudoinia panamericana (strain UAMH 10762) TaxID=717646 RepID=M2N1F7_BAUPA|nr:uncharacterized protein BAUCODRAFT_403647 [Baudoinia panamericana UAMH 10762]EMC97773.1 hypothetical protein BAUCODRAFT_403647 [Baudoinia panamericana UAMH 10762]
MTGKILPYEEYAAGSLPPRKSQAQRPAVVTEVLRRGRSKRVDRLLDLLEHGAFAALRDGYLRSVQILVHPAPDRREQVLEAYTFNIEYVRGLDNTKIVAGLGMDGPESALISVQSSIHALQQHLLNLMEMCKRLPLLPATRCIDMQLVCTPDCDKEYNLPGFDLAATTSLQFAEAHGWASQCNKLPEVDSMYHHSALQVSCLLPTTNSTSVFPEQVSFSGRCPVVEVLSATTTTADSAEGSEEAPSRISTAETASPSTIVDPAAQWQQLDEDATIDPREALGTPLPAAKRTTMPTVSADVQAAESTATAVRTATRASSGIDQSVDFTETQSSNILGMKNAFNDMMQTENMTQGDTQTQPPLLPESQPFQRRSHSVERRAVTSTGRGDHIDTQSSGKLTLSQAKARTLQADKHKLCKTAAASAKQAGRRSKIGDVILCQCGQTNEDGDMVQCAFCDTWQHLPCYGFTGSADQRLPQDHVCYRCLLGEQEMPRLNKLEDLAAKRRVMDHALHYGLSTQQSITMELELGFNKTVVKQVFDFLKSSGFIVAAPGSRKTSSRVPGKAQWLAVTDGPKHQLMLDTLFNPLLHIDHHVSRYWHLYHMNLD